MNNVSSKLKKGVLWLLASAMVILYILVSTQISYAEEVEDDYEINFFFAKTITYPFEVIVGMSISILEGVVEPVDYEQYYDEESYDEDPQCEHSNNFFTPWYCPCRKQPI